MDRAGQAGGRATLAKYGAEHFREIGKRGFDATVAKCWQGDRQGFTDWLRAKAHESRIEGFVDRELQRRIDQGEQVACMELPVLTEPDEVPW